MEWWRSWLARRSHSFWVILRSTVRPLSPHNTFGCLLLLFLFFIFYFSDQPFWLLLVTCKVICVSMSCHKSQPLLRPKYTARYPLPSISSMILSISFFAFKILPFLAHSKHEFDTKMQCSCSRIYFSNLIFSIGPKKKKKKNLILA